ncbi:Uncharacterized conserved protein [Paenibacillus sp. UNC496MF]|nr:Uncharacterized conserved protein [Paenibacillus sp. UNC496MF]
MSEKPRMEDRSIADVLQQLLVSLEGKQLKLGDLLAALKEQGPFFMLTILSVPFLQPLALPGVSTPFGILIAMLSLGILVSREVAIPRRVHAFQMPPKGVRVLFRGAIALFRKLERWSRPRYDRLLQSKRLRMLHAVLMLVTGILLLLPLPIPFSNSLPAYVVFFISLGYLLRDGLMIPLSYAFFVLTAVYFALIAFLGIEGMKLLFSRLI